MEQQEQIDNQISVISLVLTFFFSSKTEFSRNVYNLYLKIVADKYQMTKNELYNFLKYVKNVGSNSTKGNLLRTILEKNSMDANLMNAFFITCGSLDYNTEIGATLRAFSWRPSSRRL